MVDSHPRTTQSYPLFCLLVSFSFSLQARHLRIAATGDRPDLVKNAKVPPGNGPEYVLRTVSPVNCAVHPDSRTTRARDAREPHTPRAIISSPSPSIPTSPFPYLLRADVLTVGVMESIAKARRKGRYLLACRIPRSLPFPCQISAHFLEEKLLSGILGSIDQWLFFSAICEQKFFGG